MSAVEFTVPGAPVGKGRPRMAAGRMYTPAKTASYESLVAYAAAVAMRKAKATLGPKGFVVKRETLDNGRLRIRAVRR